MKKALNIKLVAAAFMLLIALAALGLVLGLALSDSVAVAEETPAENAEVTEADGEAEEAPAAPAEDNKGMIALAAAIAVGLAAPAEDDGKGIIALAAAIAVGVAAAAGAIGMAIAIAKSNESIARQPEAKNDIRSGMMLGLVFIETAIIYALIVAILIIFVL